MEKTKKEILKDLKESKIINSDLLKNYDINDVVLDYELNCEYDSRQSFYKKAYFYTITAEDKENKERYITFTALYSYDTFVCCNIEWYNVTTSKRYCGYVLNDKINDKLLFSNTTLRHIKEFLKQENNLIYNNRLAHNTNKAYIIKYNNKVYNSTDKIVID